MGLGPGGGGPGGGPGGPGGAGPGGPWDGEDAPEVREMVEAMRLARLSRALELDDEETVLLIRWYKEHQEQRRALMQERMNILRTLRDQVQGNATDASIARTLEKLMAIDEDIEQVRESAYEKARQRLSVKQQAKLYVFMNDFDREMRAMLQRARENMERRRGGPEDARLGRGPDSPGPRHGQGMGAGPGAGRGGPPPRDGQGPGRGGPPPPQ